MSRQPSAAASAAAARAPSEDKLERVRDAVRAARDLQREKADLEERLRAVKTSIYKMEREDLPTLFGQVGIDAIGLAAEGNLPAYECALRPYVRANISADWDPERRDAAFAYLESAHAEDLIKTTITVRLSRGEHALARSVVAALKKLRVQPTVELSVPWNTLTAWVRERVSKNATPKLDVIGAEVGEIVVLKPVRTGD
jgi:hypothetical protein